MGKSEIEVYEVEPGCGREMKTALDLLDAGAPVPSIGDLLLMSSLNGKGILMGGSFDAFRVVDREYMFSRLSDSRSGTSQSYNKVWIHVKRLTLDEYLAAPGATKR